jgi:hypothetical protein
MARDAGQPGSQRQIDSEKAAMEGEVTKVDKRTGKVTLKTDTGSLDLQFPPSALEKVEQGDRITVRLSMKGSNQGMTSPRQ